LSFDGLGSGAGRLTRPCPTAGPLLGHGGVRWRDASWRRHRARHGKAVDLRTWRTGHPSLFLPFAVVPHQERGEKPSSRCFIAKTGMPSEG
jgi:hypothetical protein